MTLSAQSELKRTSVLSVGIGRLLADLLELTKPRVTFLVCAVILNLFFIIVGLQGLWVRHLEQWARRLFLVSLIYLSVLYAVLLIP